MHSHQNQAGFTLLELLVALSIFALIGMGAHAMLQSVLRGREVAQAHSQQLTQTQKAVWMIAQDIMQMEPGSETMGGSDYAVRLTRRGWRNPLSLPRSDRLRVAYRLNNSHLVRYYWPAGHEADEPQTQALLDDVSAINFLSLKRAIEFTITTRAYGDIRRVIEVAEP